MYFILEHLYYVNIIVTLWYVTGADRKTFENKIFDTPTILTMRKKKNVSQGLTDSARKSSSLTYLSKT